jgi:hypothetical protein
MARHFLHTYDYRTLKPVYFKKASGRRGRMMDVMSQTGV